MTFSSQHHSFDILLASRYGIECAILIHHFQHWIRINQASNRNLREGRCWTYQTRKEIQAHFPYWSFEEVRYLCEKLVSKGVLVTNNFNKCKIDKTLWYAFKDEKLFGVDRESSKKFYERENSPSKGKIPISKGKIPTPIPDSKPDPKAKENPPLPPPTKSPESSEDLKRKMISLGWTKEEFGKAWEKYVSYGAGEIKNVEKWLISVLKSIRLEGEKSKVILDKQEKALEMRKDSEKKLKNDRLKKEQSIKNLINDNKNYFNSIKEIGMSMGKFGSITEKTVKLIDRLEPVYGERYNCSVDFHEDSFKEIVEKHLLN